MFHLGEISQFFVSKLPNDPSLKQRAFTICISGPTTVFLHANQVENGHEVIILLYFSILM